MKEFKQRKSIESAIEILNGFDFINVQSIHSNQEFDKALKQYSQFIKINSAPISKVSLNSSDLESWFFELADVSSKEIYLMINGFLESVWVQLELLNNKSSLFELWQSLDGKEITFTDSDKTKVYTVLNEEYDYQYFSSVLL